MIIFSRNERFHTLVLNICVNGISFLSKGQQVVAHLEDPIGLQTVDNLKKDFVHNLWMNYFSYYGEHNITVITKIKNIEEANPGEIDG